MSSQTSNFRDTYDGEEMKCRKCGKWTTAEWVDIGVGFQQVTPYKCECGWQQGDIVEPIDAINLRTLQLAKQIKENLVFIPGGDYYGEIEPGKIYRNNFPATITDEVLSELKSYQKDFIVATALAMVDKTEGKIGSDGIFFYDPVFIGMDQDQYLTVEGIVSEVDSKLKLDLIPTIRFDKERIKTITNELAQIALEKLAK